MMLHYGEMYICLTKRKTSESHLLILFFSIYVVGFVELMATMQMWCYIMVKCMCWPIYKNATQKNTFNCESPFIILVFFLYVTGSIGRNANRMMIHYGEMYV